PCGRGDVPYRTPLSPMPVSRQGWPGSLAGPVTAPTPGAGMPARAPTGRRSFPHRGAGCADPEGKSRWPAGCSTETRATITAGMVGGRGDQDEIHHHVVDDVLGRDEPAEGGPRLPSASRIDGDHLFLLRVSEVVGLRGADVDSLHQQRS